MENLKKHFPFLKFARTTKRCGARKIVFDKRHITYNSWKNLPDEIFTTQVPKIDLQKSA